MTLPLVVLISFLAQPRLQFAMAEDGLLPKVLCSVSLLLIMLSFSLNWMIKAT